MKRIYQSINELYEKAETEMGTVKTACGSLQARTASVSEDSLSISPDTLKPGQKSEWSRPGRMTTGLRNAAVGVVDRIARDWLKSTAVSCRLI